MGFEIFFTMFSNQILTKAPENWFQTSPPTLCIELNKTPNALFQVLRSEIFSQIVSKQRSTKGSDELIPDPPAHTDLQETSLSWTHYTAKGCFQPWRYEIFSHQGLEANIHKRFPKTDSRRPHPHQHAGRLTEKVWHLKLPSISNFSFR